MCKAKAKVGRKQVVVQTMGWRGRHEARTDLGDLRQARSFIVYKKDAKGLKIGKTVTITIAGKKVRCKVKRWSRGSRLLLPVSQYPLRNVSPKRLRRALVR